MKKKIKLWILLLSVISPIVFACLMKNDKKPDKLPSEIILPGKIAVSLNDTCFICNGNGFITSKFKIKKEDQIEYAYFTWLHKTDSFVGIEYVMYPAHKILQGNIVSFDLSGNIIDRIYDSTGEIAGIPSLSANDSLLLFSSATRGDPGKDPFAGFNAKKSIVIMDFKKKEIIRIIEGFSVALEPLASAWVYGENRFLFSISEDRQIIVGEDRVNRKSAYHPGVYIYDLATNQKKLLIPDGHDAKCSPVDRRFIYIKGQSIYLGDFQDNLEKKIFTGETGNIPHINWSPDGKFVYLLCYDKNLHGVQEKLIDADTGKEIPFKKIGHGFHTYSWK